MNQQFIFQKNIWTLSTDCYGLWAGFHSPTPGQIIGSYRTSSPEVKSEILVFCGEFWGGKQQLKMESGGSGGAAPAAKSTSTLKPNYVLKFTLAGHTKVWLR